jgi:hypothetical protein
VRVWRIRLQAGRFWASHGGCAPVIAPVVPPAAHASNKCKSPATGPNNLFGNGEPDVQAAVDAG